MGKHAKTTDPQNCEKRKSEKPPDENRTTPRARETSHAENTKNGKTTEPTTRGVKEKTKSDPEQLDTDQQQILATSA